MDSFFLICRGISVGIIAGFLAGGVKIARKKKYTEARSRSARKILNKLAFILKYVTFLLLSLGLVWCTYFLVLGVLVPDQADYANSISELIIGVLTVISIIFAFVEFLRQTEDKR
ncbi:MAG: transporter [Eubacteriales bacterium]|nr:transporter [Eubacteriales bacterium]